MSAANPNADFVVIEIDGKEICSPESFHKTFADAFGFPDFYGNNMDAWIECMGELANPEAGMSKLNSRDGMPVTISLKHVTHLRDAAPEMYESLIDCTAFVNWQQLADGQPPLLAIAFYE